jgi:hypothetical protein
VTARGWHRWSARSAVPRPARRSRNAKADETHAEKLRMRRFVEMVIVVLMAGSWAGGAHAQERRQSTRVASVDGRRSRWSISRRSPTGRAAAVVGRAREPGYDARYDGQHEVFEAEFALRASRHPTKTSTPTLDNVMGRTGLRAAIGSSSYVGLTWRDVRGMPGSPHHARQPQFARA